MQCSGEVERWSSATHFLHERGQEMVTRRLWHIRGAHHCMQPSHIHLTVLLPVPFCDSSNSFPPSPRQPGLGVSIQLQDVLSPHDLPVDSAPKSSQSLIAGGANHLVAARALAGCMHGSGRTRAGCQLTTISKAEENRRCLSINKPDKCRATDPLFRGLRGLYNRQGGRARLVSALPAWCSLRELPSRPTAGARAQRCPSSARSTRL